MQVLNRKELQTIDGGRLHFIHGLKGIYNFLSGKLKDAIDYVDGLLDARSKQ